MSISDPGQYWISFQRSLLANDLTNPSLYSEEGVYSFEMREAEGQVPQVIVERDQTGLQFLSRSQPKFVNVVWSPTGKREDARRIFAGRIDEIPADLTGPTQTIQASAGTVAFEGHKSICLAAGKRLYGKAPYFDPKFDDCREDDPDSYLLGVCGFYDIGAAGVDDVEVSDYLVGKRVVDLVGKVLHDENDVYARTISTAQFGPPVGRMRGRLKVAFTRAVDGVTNVAPMIGQFHTLDPTFGQNVDGAVSIINEGSGWTYEGGALVACEAYGAGTAANIGMVTIPRAAKYRIKSTVGGRIEEYEDYLAVTLSGYTVSPRRIPVGFSVTQDYEETLDIEVETSMQVDGDYIDGYAAFADDVVEMSITDPYEGLSTKMWTADTTYEKGDLVVFSGKIYRARETHEATTFHQMSSEFDIEYTGGDGNSLPYRVYKPMWQEQSLGDQTFSQLSRTYFLTDEGLARAEHAVLRVAKEARKRLRVLRCGMTVSWADGVGLSCRDSVRFEIWNGKRIQKVVGKVVALTKRWPEEGVPTVDIEVGISIGTSDRTPDTSYFSGGYTKASYTKTVRGGLTPQNPGGIAGDLKRTLLEVEEVDPTRLSDPDYALFNRRIFGTASSQGNAAKAIAAAKGDVRKCTSVNPTRIGLVMIDLPPPSIEPRERKFKVDLRLTDSPMGIDIEGGDV